VAVASCNNDNGPAKSIVDVDSVIGMGKFRAAHPTLKNKRPPRRNAKWRAAARGPADHIGQNLDIMS